jgi:hypothetical protein
LFPFKGINNTLNKSKVSNIRESLVKGLESATSSSDLACTIGFTIEYSTVAMIITYRTNYVNQLNFIRESVSFIIYGFEIYPLSMFVYPDGSLSENLFSDLSNFLKLYRQSLLFLLFLDMVFIKKYKKKHQR